MTSISTSEVIFDSNRGQEGSDRWSRYNKKSNTIGIELASRRLSETKWILDETEVQNQHLIEGLTILCTSNNAIELYLT